MTRLLLRGGRVIDPVQGLDAVCDVLVEDGRIATVSSARGAPDRPDALAAAAEVAHAPDAPAPEPGAAHAAQVLDATGLVVAPGFVDPHAHLCEPGWEHRETISTGVTAAAAGGYTAVCAMPDTDPAVDDPAAVGFVVAAGRRAKGARVFPAAAATVGRAGERLTEFGELVEAGAVAVGDAGRAIRSSALMRLALEYAQSFDVPVLAHSEDPWLAEGGVMHEGVVSTRLGLRGKPAAAEEIGVARDLALAEATGGRVHLQRVSTATSCRLIRQARERGVRVTAEATPHHLLLSHDLLESYGANYKVDPPLRPRADVEAVQTALAEGVIDAVATDHAPRHYDEKEEAFDDAPFGAVGLETAFAALHTELVRKGVMPLSTLLARLSSGPARALGLPDGLSDGLAPGSPADLVLLDLEAEWEVDPDAFLSKSRNTPFAGRPVVGRVVRTLVAGETVWTFAR